MIPKFVICPYCKKETMTDSNNNLYFDCPGCFQRIYLEDMGSLDVI